MTVASLLIAAGCVSSPPPASNMAASYQGAMCQSKAYELVTRCQSASAAQPELLVEMLRAELTTFGPGCERELAPAEQCVAGLEASFNSSDPDREPRRAAARSRAVAVRARPEYKKLVADLIEVRDAIEISCRSRNRSRADARECERWEARGTTAADRLRAYLKQQRFDARDYNTFQLWPGGAAVAARN